MRRHDIPQLIALTLTASSLGGCGWLFGCGKDNSSDTPLSVSDWNVTQERYDAIVDTAVIGSDETGGGLEDWDSADATTRCNWACAYALGEQSVYQGDDYQHTLSIESCELSVPTADGDGTLSCNATLHFLDICIGGRRPLAWTGEASTGAARQLDAMAVMEHVSVTAFIELAAQLELRGAPAELVARCRAAADDERRHVDLLVGLGARRPEQTPEPAAAETAALEIALHNAVEGCVVETWAALLARHQAEHAPDPSARAAFERIAADEAQHAQLAWDLHAYFMRALEAVDAAAVRAAQADALARLEQTAIQQALAVSREVRERLGLPDPQAAATLARDFGRRLAAAA